MTELWQHTATELAAMIRDREVSSREVVEAHLKRIDAVNGTVNAVTVTLAESALAAADAADSRPAAGAFHGVPFTIKENIDCMGSATTQGLPAMKDDVPSVNSPVVERMLAAGAIPLARTNMPEMGLRIATDNPLRGRTSNPYDLSRTVGGSSGGEGAALATGMSCIGLGNDIGGSLRNPAYCCGISSLKPTTGRIPFALSLSAVDIPIGFRLMQVEGPMARSVADLRTACGVLAGYHPRDPASASVPLEGPEAPKRAGVVTAIPGMALPPATQSAIRRAADCLASAGWEIDEIEAPELELVNELWGRVLAGDLGIMLPLLSRVMTEHAIAMLEKLLARFDSKDMSTPAVWTERDRLVKVWSELFTRYAVVLGPTWTDLPFQHDADIDPASGIDTTLSRLRFITPGNLLGIPAVCVPTGEADGLPTGVQVYSERWREDLCFSAAADIEAAVGAPRPIDPRG